MLEIPDTMRGDELAPEQRADRSDQDGHAGDDERQHESTVESERTRRPVTGDENDGGGGAHPPAAREAEPRDERRHDERAGHDAPRRQPAQPLAARQRVERVDLDLHVAHRSDRRLTELTARLAQDQHDPVVHQLLNDVDLPGFDRRPDFLKRHHARGGAPDAVVHQHVGARIDGNMDLRRDARRRLRADDERAALDRHALGRSVHAGDRESEGECGHSSVSGRDEERHAADDAVRIGRRERVPDGASLSNESRDGICGRGCVGELQGNSRSHRPGRMAFEDRPARRSAIAVRRFERDRVDDGLGQLRGLAQERVARRSSSCATA